MEGALVIIKIFDKSGLLRERIGTDEKSSALISLEFEINRVGGCGMVRIVLDRDIGAEINDLIEIWYLDKLSWKGFLSKKVIEKDRGVELIGYGLVDRLSWIIGSGNYLESDIKVVLRDIYERYLRRVGIGWRDEKVVSGQVLKNFNFLDIRIREALEKLSEWFGEAEWGVDEAGDFYWRAKSGAIIDYLDEERELREFRVEVDDKDLVTVLVCEIGNWLGKGWSFVRIKASEEEIQKFGIRMKYIKVPFFESYEDLKRWSRNYLDSSRVRVKPRVSLNKNVWIEGWGVFKVRDWIFSLESKRFKLDSGRLDFEYILEGYQTELGDSIAEVSEDLREIKEDLYRESKKAEQDFLQLAEKFGFENLYLDRFDTFQNLEREEVIEMEEAVSSVALDERNDWLYLGGYGKLWRYDLKSGEKRVWTGTGLPDGLGWVRSLAVDLDGKIYILDGYRDRIVRIDDIDGRGLVYRGRNGSGGSGSDWQFNQASQIEVTPQRVIIVADSGNYRVVLCSFLSNTLWTVYDFRNVRVNWNLPPGSSWGSIVRLSPIDVFRERYGDRFFFVAENLVWYISGNYLIPWVNPASQSPFVGLRGGQNLEGKFWFLDIRGFPASRLLFSESWGGSLREDNWVSDIGDQRDFIVDRLKRVFISNGSNRVYKGSFGLRVRDRVISCIEDKAFAVSKVIDLYDFSANKVIFQARDKGEIRYRISKNDGWSYREIRKGEEIWIGDMEDLRKMRIEAEMKKGAEIYSWFFGIK